MNVEQLDPDAIIPHPICNKQAVGVYSLHNLRTVIIPAKKCMVLRTGIAIKVPQGFVAEITPIPYLQSRHEDIDVARITLSSIDDQEINIIVTNNGDSVFNIPKGDPIARMFFLPVMRPEIRGIPKFINNQ